MNVKEDETMPILEQQEQIIQPTSSSSVGRNKRTIIVKTEPADEHDYALPGFYKKGSRIYNRNTVRCPLCPFRTQSKVRLEPHMAGHERLTIYFMDLIE